VLFAWVLLTVTTCGADVVNCTASMVVVLATLDNGQYVVYSVTTPSIVAVAMDSKAVETTLLHLLSEQEVLVMTVVMLDDW
jgi:hypothetical protein